MDPGLRSAATQSGVRDHSRSTSTWFWHDSCRTIRFPGLVEVSLVRELSDLMRSTPAELASRVETALAAMTIYGLDVAANLDGEALLDGTVRTAADFEAASRLARIPGVRRVINHLTVDPLAGSMPVQNTVLSPELAAQIELNHLHVAPGTEIDFNEPIGTSDPAIATDEAEPYFPATDPPTRRAPRSDQGIEVVGGFSGTSLDAPIDLEQLPRALLSGDDEIAREVRLALRGDAATCDLAIKVTVRGGIARLRGAVESLDDAELAEAVAAQVPNVVDVVDELEVPGM